MQRLQVYRLLVVLLLEPSNFAVTRALLAVTLSSPDEAQAEFVAALVELALHHRALLPLARELAQAELAGNTNENTLFRDRGPWVAVLGDLLGRKRARQFLSALLVPVHKALRGKAGSELGPAQVAVMVLDQLRVLGGSCPALLRALLQQLAEAVAESHVAMPRWTLVQTVVVLRWIGPALCDGAQLIGAPPGELKPAQRAVLVRALRLLMAKVRDQGHDSEAEEDPPAGSGDDSDADEPERAAQRALAAMDCGLAFAAMLPSMELPRRALTAHLAMNSLGVEEFIAQHRAGSSGSLPPASPPARTSGRRGSLGRDAEEGGEDGSRRSSSRFSFSLKTLLSPAVTPSASPTNSPREKPSIFTRQRSNSAAQPVVTADPCDEFVDAADDRLLPLHEVVVNQLLVRQRALFAQIQHQDAGVFQWLTEMLRSIEADL